MRYIDFSQYKTWMDCPRKWYNTYVEQVRPIPSRALNDGPLTLGSLVHNGLEYLAIHNKIKIDDETITEEKPTPQCLSDAYHILNSYAKYIVNEPYVVSKVEETLSYKVNDNLTMVAKVDEYFHLDEPIDLPRGNGEYFTLEPGWWLREQKTKSGKISYESFAMRWAYDKQADFQLLCLSEHIQQPVNGVLINVIEKAVTQQPKRKCKGCLQLLPFESYEAVTKGFKCSICGHVQQHKPLTPEQLLPKDPKFFRLYTRRSLECISRTIDTVELIAERMERMRKEGIQAEPPRITEGACSHMIFGPCKFMPLCITESGLPIPALDHGKYEKADTTRYMGLPEATKEYNNKGDS